MGKLLPKSPQDRFLLAFFVSGGHLALWYELCMVLPHYSSKGRTSDLAFWFHLALAAFMYVNGLANLYKMRMAKLSGDHDVLLRARRESLDETTWIFCVKCQDHIPPRSHHCPLCDECILRRDHHCWFAGCCVGIANHRYYLVIIVYVLIVAVYTNVYNFEYVGEVMGGHTVGAWLCIMAPHMAVVFGLFDSFHQFFVAVVTFIAYFFMVLVAVLLKEQIQYILNGQTKYERKKDIRLYNQGWKKNVRELLGDRWILVFLWPWTKSPPSDGIKFVKSD